MARRLIRDDLEAHQVDVRELDTGRRGTGCRRPQPLVAYELDDLASDRPAIRSRSFRGMEEPARCSRHRLGHGTCSARIASAAPGNVTP